ncbi:Lem3/Cdc50 [Periconia macrospinosa]|uniref:Lem3/Cdc50 n=1 Tax=Periconia macrospinosa TaxID=97972 RepID=A0A2V1DUH2_9PLEO|nr:Lem3/Cdc50 [Periconia macrospinosa]
MSQTQQVEHSDSISSQDPRNETQKKTKSRRPPNTAFRQQRLKAWQPILTPKTVLPIFFIVGIIFAPIGALLLWASSQVQELSIDYTNCDVDSPQVDAVFDPNQRTEDMGDNRVSASFSKPMRQKPSWGHFEEMYEYPSSHRNLTKFCVLVFDIPVDIKPPVLFYYRLDNFYQNHRRYVKSFDINQLKGDAVSSGDIGSGECDPLSNEYFKGDPDKRPIYPCGLIANSMFNDTYWNLNASNPSQDSGGNSNATYDFERTGIIWSTEADLYGETKYQPKDIRPPPNWIHQFPEGGYDNLSHDQLPNLHTNEAFQVWMRTAGLPYFSKLAMRNDKDVLQAGTYRLRIRDLFPVQKYGGKKSILISTRTVMGGKNDFLGIAYIVVGGLCIVLGTVFTLTHLVKPRKLGDHTYLSWNNEPSTATTTGRDRA